MIAKRWAWLTTIVFFFTYGMGILLAEMGNGWWVLFTGVASVLGCALIPVWCLTRVGKR